MQKGVSSDVSVLIQIFPLSLPHPQIVPNVEQSTDGYLAQLAEEKMVVVTTSTTGKAPVQGGHKTLAQKASSHQPHSHDSNNNVSVTQGVTLPPPQKKVVSTASVAVTAVPGRSPMASPKVRHEPTTVAPEPVVVNGNVGPATAAVKTEVVVQKANAILQTDVVLQQQQHKKLETNTVSVTATPAAINGVGEKVQQPAVATAAPPAAPSSWASLFASSQRPAAPDGANGPVVGSKKPVAKVLPFEGTQVQQAAAVNTAGTMSYSAASSMGLSTTTTTTQSGLVGSVQRVTQEHQQQAQEQSNDASSVAERRGFKLGGE